MKNKKYRSLSFQIPVIFIISYLIIAIVIVLVVSNRFNTRMIDDYTRMAEGVTNLMADVIDPAKIDEYIEKNYAMEEYDNILKYYYKLKANYPDIYYMYVYRFEHSNPPEATVIIDLDEVYSENPPQDSIDWIGDTYVADEPFASEIDIMMNGRQPLVHTVHTMDGEYLLSYVRPVYDEDGNYVCSCCVDFSMAHMHKQDMQFLLRLMSVLGVLMLLILIINIINMNNYVTAPLNRISNCIDSFNFETESDRFKNVQMLEGLDIKRENEIGKLYKNFVSSMQESLFYMSNYNRAVGEIENKDKEIAKISVMTYKDTLTQVSNKTAYVDDEAKINKELKEGLTEIAVMVADINNLKYINDTFGHDKGDKYITGCCNILRDTFKNSNVYRIGGDEFLILIREEDFENRNRLYNLIIQKYSECYSNTNENPWHRYSASVGMAEFIEGDKLSSIVKRADKKMYDNKMEFKKINGSYR